MEHKEGRVISFDGRYYRIDVEGDELSPYYLTPLEVYPGIEIGDLVKLEWRREPSRAYWRATTCLER